MFSLTNIIAWFTEILRPQEGDVNNDSTHLTGEEIEELLSDLDSTILDKEDNENNTTLNRMTSGEISFEFLRVSDSEDWDEEISMLERRTEANGGPLAGLKYDESTDENMENKRCLDSRGSDNDMQRKPFYKKDILQEEHNISQTQLHKPKNKKYNEEYTSFTSCTSELYSNNETVVANKEATSIPNRCESLSQDNSRVNVESKQENVSRANVYENQFNWDYMEKLTNLETVFSLPEKDQFLLKLRRTLESVSSPYSFLLYLVENYYSNVIEGKNSMAHIALSHFLKWCKDEQFCVFEPTEMEKDRALWIVTTRKLYLFDLCNKVFHLDSKGNEYLQKHIYYLLESKKRYKEAVTIAYKLHLQPCFEPKEILLPLIILNKVQLAESYIADCPYQQRAFVSMLDKLCVMPDESLDALANEIIPRRPLNCKITQASLTKLGERIVKKFQLDPDDFPELFKVKNRNGLSYLLHQRQKDKNGSSKKWDDLIERCVGSNLTLQQTLVKLLNDYGDKMEAQMWAKYYQLPCAQAQHSKGIPGAQVKFEADKREDWDSDLQRFNTSNKEGNSERWNKRCLSKDVTAFSSRSETVTENEFLDHQKPAYLELEIPMGRIFFVDDDHSLRSCQREITKPGMIVGFDAEWKPQMCQAGLPQRLSIMQLSLRNKVYILDVIAMGENVSEAVLLSFGNALFANENVLKLGYGVESDFKALITTLPVLEKSIKKMKRFVDLCNLSQQLFEVPAMEKRIEKQTKSLMSFGHLSEKGLSLLVQQCLGLPLDKTYQLSDWEQRPLLEKQVVYAALDARCLLDVFDVLNKWIKEEKIEVDLNECCPRLPWLFPKRSRKPKGKVSKQPKPGSSNCDTKRLNQPALQGSSNSPQNFRVVVDNMLQGLGRYLRCCGVDVVMLANEDGHEKAAKIAQREGRVLLTTGTPYYTLRSQVPIGQCMCVPAGSAKEQVLSVFKHFNISVKTSDIFSRCQLCNGNEYITVNSILMRQAYMNYQDNKVDNAETTYSLLNNQASSPLDVNTLILRSGVKLQIAALPESILDKVGLFYCCATCGKIFWEGGHFTKICSQFSEVLNSTESFYEATSSNVASIEQQG